MRAVSCPVGSFNPRSRKGNDTETSERACYSMVSIHVPARGTTASTRLVHCAYIWFQSTFPQGERPTEDDLACIQSVFQSTFPQGERQGASVPKPQCGRFNPRSRKGNDKCTRNTVWVLRCFNPRSRKGNDDRGPDVLPDKWVSIHVPARGTTRSSTGSLVIDSVSIHVPARGTTQLCEFKRRVLDVSIHVPARGTTRSGSHGQAHRDVSIHVPARGTTGK